MVHRIDRTPGVRAGAAGYWVSAMRYVTVTFAHGESKKFVALVQLQGAPFDHYRLGRSQAYAVEIAVAHEDVEEWLPRLRRIPIAKIECVTGELAEHVSVVGTVLSPMDVGAIVVLDALVVLKEASVPNA